MDAKPEQPKAAPVMDVVPPPAVDEKLNTVSADAAAQSEADDPAVEPTVAQAPPEEPAPAVPNTVQEAPQAPEQHSVPAPQPQTPRAPSNPAMPIVIATIVVMIVLSAIAVYAYLKSVR